MLSVVSIKRNCSRLENQLVSSVGKLISVSGSSCYSQFTATFGQILCQLWRPLVIHQVEANGILDTLSHCSSRWWGYDTGSTQTRIPVTLSRALPHRPFGSSWGNYTGISEPCPDSWSRTPCQTSRLVWLPKKPLSSLLYVEVICNEMW